MKPPPPSRSILCAGTVASLTSAAALALGSRIEGKGAFRPLNATSHWLRGETAARRDDVDLAHTGVGYTTHLAATIFWAALFEALLRMRSRPVPMLAAAALTSAVAAAVDYGVTPRRFTPGWEFALTKTSMGAGYAAMAVGLAVGRRLA